MTRQLRGEPLTKLLRKSSPPDFAALLRATGIHLRRCHEIVYLFPGYLADAQGPQSAPEEGGWIHFYCSAAFMQETSLSWFEKNRPNLPPALAQELRERLLTLQRTLAPEFEPPRFIQGDCHAHQFYLFQEHGRWTVSGSIDMEVASAGAPICDLLKFCKEMADGFPTERRWWDPFFEGYGSTPDFERFRLLMLGDCAGGSASRIEQLLSALKWEELFRSSLVSPTTS